MEAVCDPHKELQTNVVTFVTIFHF